MSAADEDSTKHALKHWNPRAGLFQRGLCRAVVQTSRFIMQTMNSVAFEGTERWEAAFGHPGRGVLSFSNHVSLFDDPLLVSNLGRVRFNDVRWIGADHINFYGSALKGFISAAGKCVPIIRGGGLVQPGLAFLCERLQAGDWVHIFPEGGRTRDPDARMRLPFKAGIGHLIAEAKPIAMPFYHYGMHRILPIGRTLPKAGHSVTVRFGEAAVIDDEWLAPHVEAASEGAGALYRRLADWTQEVLLGLEAETHEMGARPTDAAGDSSPDT